MRTSAGRGVQEVVHDRRDVLANAWPDLRGAVGPLISSGRSCRFRRCRASSGCATATTGRQLHQSRLPRPSRPQRISAFCLTASAPPRRKRYTSSCVES
jgi:hypothetical protein